MTGIRREAPDMGEVLGGAPHPLEKEIRRRDTCADRPDAAAAAETVASKANDLTVEH